MFALPMTLDLLVRGGTVVLHRGLARVDLGVRAGKICAIGELDPGSAALVVDARGLHVLPGVIDTQVHLREPGLEARETIDTGTRAAVLGGVTAVLELPDTRPPTVGAAALEDKISRFRAASWCDFACFLGPPPDEGDLPRLERLPGCAGVAVYMSGQPRPLLVDDDEHLLRVLGRGHRRLSVHCEDEARVLARGALAPAGADPSVHPEWRDVDCSARATQRLLHLARRAGRRVHLMHLSSAEECALAEPHRDLATVGVTIHHLTLCAPGCYVELGARAVAHPPIRDERHRAALWRAVQDGLVDLVASDHAPQLADDKAQAYPAAPPGLPGVQALLPLMLEHVHAGRLSLPHAVELLSTGPARVYQVARKGRIAVGLDADLVLVDLAAADTLRDEAVASRCGWTPYHGHRVHGLPRATILRGELVARDGQLLGDPTGAPLRFADTLRMVAL
jgi:dihydroorotase